jgi:hypothetical protein
MVRRVDINGVLSRSPKHCQVICYIFVVSIVYAARMALQNKIKCPPTQRRAPGVHLQR